MSLHTDNVFIAAIRSSSELMTVIGNRLYGTAIPVPEEDVINEPIPYLIVMFDGLNNEGQTKDNPFEGDADVVNISVLATAKTLDALHGLTAMVRNVIKTYLTENDTVFLYIALYRDIFIICKRGKRNDRLNDNFRKWNGGKI